MLKIKRNNLIDIIYDSKMSVKEISKKAGVNEKTIYNIIKKRNTPRLTLAKTLARIFGKSIDELFEFEEEKSWK